MTIRTLAFLLFSAACQAATYYVDFDGGSDASAGTSTDAAWKHFPDDANATGTSAAHTPAAGNTYIFKGGVLYKGSILIESSGSDGNPIVLDGNSSGAWGTGKAVLDGSAVIGTSWTQCTDSADAGGNSNFANIYWTTVPAGVTTGWNQVIMDGTTQCHTSQDPNPTNRFLFDVVTQWRLMSSTEVDTTSITDTGYFTQASSADWNEASVGIWVSGNAVDFRPILSFTPGTDTITFATITPYENRDSYFCTFNHPRLIDQAGETAVNVAENRLYVWPPDSGDMSGHVWSIGSLGYGIGFSQRGNLTIDNFSFRGYFSLPGVAGYTGCAITGASTVTNGRNNIVSDCDAKFLKSMDRDWLMTIGAGNGSQALRNSITYSFGGGIFMGGDGVVVDQNTLYTLTGTGIYTPGTTNTTISRNSLINIQGTHANGISIYQGADTVEVSSNLVRNSPSLLTYQNSNNLTFVNNVFDAFGQDQQINDWGGSTGVISWYNNTMVNNSVTHIWRSSTPESESVQFIIKNNIIDGGSRYDTDATRSNNIYTFLASYQTGPLWTYQTGESSQTEADLFTTPGSDYTLKAGSPAINAGADLSVYFTTDIMGATRTGSWDIGAYEYVTYDATHRQKTRAGRVRTLMR